MSGRSPEAKARRAAKRRELKSGSRVVCDACNRLHPPPACEDGELSVPLSLTLRPWLHRRLVEEVPWGDRSGFVADLIEEALT